MVISKSDAAKRESDDRWLIRSNRYPVNNKWFRANGHGLSGALADAHRYTWMDAVKHRHRAKSDTTHHVSDVDGAIESDG